MVLTDVLWIVISILSLSFLVIALVLQHHWSYYGVGDSRKVIVKSIFWLVGIILLFVLVLLAASLEI
jgi:hypothetical protein